MSLVTLNDSSHMIPAEDQIVDFIRLSDPLGTGATEVDERKRIARSNFQSFMDLMYPHYLDGTHLIALRSALESVEAGEIDRLIITMPPRHSKSMHVSEGFPAWYLGRNPHNRVIAASHTMTLARKFSRRVRAHFRDPMWPFPSVAISRESASVEQWEIEGSPTGGYLAVGVGGSPTGQGGDLIIIDDPIKSEADAASALIRENLWEWYEGTMFTRRQPGASIIVTATRWHEDDLTGRLLKEMAEGGEEWHHLSMPAADDSGNYLWPEFWSPVEYEKARMGSDRVWMAQYMGSPVKKGGNLLKEEWFGTVIPGEKYYGIVQAWDCAEEAGVTNDYSVCVTIAISESGYDILHIWRDQVEFPDLLQASQDQATWIQSIYPGIPYVLAIENASSGRQLIQVLERETRLPVHRVEVENKKDAKVQRVIRTTPIVKARRVRLQPQASWRSAFFREIKGFPYEAHDDIVDATMIGVEIAAAGMSGGTSSKSYLEDDQEKDWQMGAIARRRRRSVGPDAIT